MKRTSSQLLAAGAALVLSLSLLSCGGSTDTGDSASTEGKDAPAAEPAVVSHEAEMKPDLVEPGWLYGDNTSDIWWPNGQEGSGEGIYFTNAANDAGMDVTFVNEAGEDVDSVWYLEVADDHLVTLSDAPEEKRKVDFTFQGNFNCYDAVSGIAYARGDRSQQDYDALLEGHAFAEDPEKPEEYTLRFEPDGVVVQEQGSYDPLEGTWQVISTNTVVCHFQNGGSEWDSQYRFQIADGDVVEQLDSGGPTPLQLLS